MHATLTVHASPEAGDVPAWRHQEFAVGTVGRDWVVDLDPRVVERRKRRVVHGGIAAPFLDLLDAHSRGRIEDGHPVSCAFAVIDQRSLHLLPHTEVDAAVLHCGCSNEIGNHHHGHIVGNDEAIDAGAVVLASREGLGLYLDRIWGGFLQRERAGLQHGHRRIEVGINRLKGGDPNLFGLGIHHRFDVAVTRDDRHIRERFGFGAVGHNRDRERCRCVVIVALFGRDHDRDVSIRLDRLDRHRLTERPIVCRQRFHRRLASGLNVRNAHDVADAAAIVEPAVHRVREHGAWNQAAIQVLKLGPARNETGLEPHRIGRIVGRTFLGETDEGRNRSRARGECCRT